MFVRCPSTNACFKKESTSFRQALVEAWLAGSIIASSSPEDVSGVRPSKAKFVRVARVFVRSPHAWIELSCRRQRGATDGGPPSIRARLAR
jgi:hypothetical protein